MTVTREQRIKFVGHFSVEIFFTISSQKNLALDGDLLEGGKFKLVNFLILLILLLIQSLNYDGQLLSELFYISQLMLESLINFSSDFLKKIQSLIQLIKIVQKLVIRFQIIALFVELIRLLFEGQTNFADLNF